MHTHTNTIARRTRTQTRAHAHRRTPTHPSRRARTNTCKRTRTHTQSVAHGHANARARACAPTSLCRLRGVRQCTIGCAASALDASNNRTTRHRPTKSRPHGGDAGDSGFQREGARGLCGFSADCAAKLKGLSPTHSRECSERACARVQTREVSGPEYIPQPQESP